MHTNQVQKLRVTIAGARGVGISANTGSEDKMTPQIGVAFLMGLWVGRGENPQTQPSSNFKFITSDVDALCSLFMARVESMHFENIILANVHP